MKNKYKKNCNIFIFVISLSIELNSIIVKLKKWMEEAKRGKVQKKYDE